MSDSFLGLPPAAALAAAAVLGACCGSFSNVLIHRLPRNLGVVKGRSFCPHCAKMIAWYDNVPVLSWLLLRGRCRHCGAGIPARYPLVELAGAGCAVLGVLRFGYGPEGWGAALLLLLLVDIALIDWEHMIIPHTLTVTGMVTVMTAGRHFPATRICTLPIWYGNGPRRVIPGSVTSPSRPRCSTARRTGR